MKAQRIDRTPQNGTTEHGLVWKGYLITPTPTRWQRIRAAIRRLWG